MMSVSRAQSAEDFEVAAVLCRALGQWDATQAPLHGVPPELVLDLFHDDNGALSDTFTMAGAGLFIARWEGVPAGCIAFAPFDDVSVEFHKFYVDPHFRGRRIGRALMQATLAEVSKGPHVTALLHTTIYMKNAISVYEASGFRRCPPYREIPDSIRHTEVFMSRPL